MRPIVLALILTAGRGPRGDAGSCLESGSSADDLTLSNFFSEGGTRSGSRRRRCRMGLRTLRYACADKLSRAGARTDFYYENNMEKGETRDVQYLNQYSEYSFNRRFMLSLFTNYTWENEKWDRNESGAGGGVMGRFQLVDNADIIL